MTFDDLKELYDKKKQKYGENAYQYVSELFIDAKLKHKKDFKGNDHEQSWRAFKGKNLEKLIEHIITDKVTDLGLAIINGNTLERSTNLQEHLAIVKRNLLIDYGKFGCHLPDVDLVIYNPKNSKVLAVLSIKVTLRERIAQTAYWKLKLSHQKITNHIKVFFITPDEDQTLKNKKPIKKGRAIVEADLDGTYVLSENPIETTNKVKTFDKFIVDLKKVLK